MEPSGSGLESIIKEILMHFRLISNVTGIPVFFLAPDLMSNRATASELMEMVNASTMIERENWKDTIEELCRKAMIIHTQKTGEILNYEDVEVSIPAVSLNQVQQLVDVYLPLQMAGIISKKTLREKVPNIDPEMEDERMTAEGMLMTAEGLEGAILDSQGQMETPIDIEAEAKAKLKGTVGGVDGILSIQKSVSEGITDYNAAIALLYEIYGFDTKTAKQILGTPKKMEKTKQIKPIAIDEDEEDDADDST
jgi:hypothetical protein